MSVPVRGEETSKKPLTKDAHAMAVSMLRGCAMLCHPSPGSVLSLWTQLMLCLDSFPPRCWGGYAIQKVTEIHPFQAAFCLFFVALYLRPKFANVVDKGYEANSSLLSTDLLSNLLPDVENRGAGGATTISLRHTLELRWFFVLKRKNHREWFFSEIKIRDVLFYSHFFLGFGLTRFLYSSRNWYLKIVWWQKCFGLPRCKLCRPSAES